MNVNYFLGIDLSDEAVIEEFFARDIIYLGDKVATVLGNVVYILMLKFHEDSRQFFDWSQIVIYSMTFTFLLLFTVIDSIIMINLVLRLNREIKNIQGMINMIPGFVLKSNSTVRMQLIKGTNRNM